MIEYLNILNRVICYYRNLCKDYMISIIYTEFDNIFLL